MALFSKSTFCVVTGASRGLGREIALQLAKEWSLAGVSSDVVLTATNKAALEETRALIHSQAPGVGVHIVPGDLGDIASLSDLCSQLLEHADTSRHQQSLLVNNAGTIHEFGDPPFLEQTDPKVFQNYMDVNVTSMVLLTKRFLSAFPGMPRYMVQLTSLLAKVFLPNYSLYSISRAARNAFAGTVAAEEPSVRLLSYSPGPCDTDMLRSIPDKYQLKGPDNKILTAEESICKLVTILKEDKYKNADVVDYFD